MNMKKKNSAICQSCENRKRRVGFTLVEIMVVLFIGILMIGGSALAYTSFLETGKKRTTKQYITTLETAIQSYNMDVGRYPASLQDLIICPSDVSSGKWGGPYLKHLQAADPWQNEYRYNSPGQRIRAFDVWSSGPDGQDGTEDDIGNWAD
ncbi:MAG: type II secretion system major pseudopilin GspG [Planctomycetaceae bacterium]|jgi:general secretion pathway protein G|nr:type II secretion system major pseudopilin GspG [Planctomycetaceae bacterium]